VDESRARELLDAERERLVTIQEDLRRSGVGTEGERDELDELSLMDQHPADVATETADRSRDLGFLEQYERDLADVGDALRRLEDGTYGRCQVCGRPIPDERLEADPTARFDVAHERAVEAAELGYGEAPPPR